MGPIGPIHKTVLRRLIPASALLLLIAGTLAYLIENRRIDEFVFDKATDAARHFDVSRKAPLFAGDPETHRAELDGFLQQTPFVVIRIYSPEERPLIESWRDAPPELLAAVEAHRHRFPGIGRHHHNKLWSGDRLFIQTVLPLADGDGVYGYFEGIYRVAPELVDSGRHMARDTLAVAMLVVGFSALALYPVILSLSRGGAKLSAALLESNIELMRVLGSAIAKRDSDTDEHNYRVALYAVGLAEALRRPREEIAALIAGAFLHDVGKIGVPDGILLKPGKLSDEEFAIMRTHVRIGEEIVTESKWLRGARDVVANHHEKFDGSGYPRGLRGSEIPFNARLFAVVDVFDALSSKRPYKEALAPAEVLRLLGEGRGTHFDPGILDVFAPMAPALLGEIAAAGKPALSRQLAAVVQSYFGVTLDARFQPL